MKIIFDFQDMIGGAPRSQLAHMKVMKKNGHEIVATICKDEEQLQNYFPDLKIYNVNKHSVKNPFLTYRVIKNWIKLVKNEKPDLIHSNRISQSLFLSIISDATGVPLVFAQAGGIAKQHSVKPLLGKTAVVYSLENKVAFMKFGFDENNIHVISNRIYKDDYKVDYNNQEQPLNVVITGNIKEETINGLLSIINLLKSIDTTKYVTIQIVGKPTRDSNKHFEKLVSETDNFNRSHKYIKIKMLGWIDNIANAQKKSDICIGKGRSIIQPAMLGKVGFVVSEEGFLTRINNESFNKLYEYNFSGRGDLIDSTDDFLDIIKNGLCEAFIRDADKISEKIETKYLIDHAKDKLEIAYRDALKYQKGNRNTFKALLRSIDICTNISLSKINKGNK